MSLLLKSEAEGDKKHQGNRKIFDLVSHRVPSGRCACLASSTWVEDAVIRQKFRDGPGFFNISLFWRDKGLSVSNLRRKVLGRYREAAKVQFRSLENHFLFVRGETWLEHRAAISTSRVAGAACTILPSRSIEMELKLARCFVSFPSIHMDTRRVYHRIQMCSPFPLAAVCHIA